MICEKYDELILPEKIQLIGKIHHLIQIDNAICTSIMSIVRQAENNGLLNDVTILPQRETEINS